MPETANFLAYDLGASGGRAMLGRWDGAHYTLEELHRFENGPVAVQGSLHWDALRLWTELKVGMARYAEQHTQPLSGIGVDTWGVDYGLLDRSGRLLGNPYNYRDRRTEGMIEAACAAVTRDAIFQETGIQLISINTLFQLYSAALSRDPQLEAATSLLLMPDLFHYWMTGRQAIEYTNATTTQLLNCHTRNWAAGLIDRLGIPSHILPEIVEPGTILGTLRADIAEEVGLRQMPPVITPGTHDTASAVAAVPGLDAESAYISSGTWSLVGVETHAPVVSQRAQELNVTNEGGVGGTIRLLKNVSGLWLLQESRQQWRREGHSYSWEELLAAADRAAPLRSLIDPDAPQFAVPGDLPGAVRSFCRQTGQPVPEDTGAIVRCCLESLALRYRWVLEGLEQLIGRSITTVRIVGGGSRNRQLCQFTADASGRTVVAGPVEATALGNLMVQSIAAGLVPDLAAARRALAQSVELERYTPRSDSRWQPAYARFIELMV